MALRLGIDALASGGRQTDEHEQGTASLVSMLSAKDRVTNDPSQPDYGEYRENDATSNGEPECRAQPSPVVVEHHPSLVIGATLPKIYSGVLAYHSSSSSSRGRT